MKIAIYSRKSKFTGKGDSIANQIELCKQEAQRYLHKKNIPAADAKIIVYEDEGFSGKNTARPEFQKMMAAVKAQEIDCVICYKLDRISRNVGDFARTYEDFEKYQVDFLCANEHYDTTTPAGRAMMGMVSVFAQMERETTAERIRDNMHMLARSGRWLGGHTPTGFQSQKEERVDGTGKNRTMNKLIPVSSELELIKFIYQKFIELQSISGLTGYLVQNNIRTKNGKDFTNVAVKSILRNPVYCIAGPEAGNYFKTSGADICYEEGELDNKQGFMPYNRTSSGKERQVKNEISDWLIAVGKHDGIIPAETWVRVQHILNAKQVKSKAAVRSPYKSEALLSGILVCGQCKSAMRPHVHTSRKNADGHVPYYYICELKERSSKKRCDMDNVSGSVLDKIIMEELCNFTQEDSLIRRSIRNFKEQVAKNSKAETAQLGFLQAELQSKQSQIENLLETISKGSVQDVFMERVRKKVNDLAEQCERLQAEIEKATIEDAFYTDFGDQTNAIEDALAKLKSTAQTATAVEKRELLKAIVERIIWDGKQAHIFLLGE